VWCGLCSVASRCRIPDCGCGPTEPGQPPDLVRLLKQLHEYGHFRLQDLRDEGLGQEIHGPGGIALKHLRVGALVGGQEKERRVPGPLPLPDQLGGLEPIQAVHSHFQQDQRKVMVEHPSDGLRAGSRFDEIVAQVFQDRLEGEELGEPGELAWFPDRSYAGRTYIPAVARTTEGFELFGLPLIIGDPANLLVLTTYLFKLTNILGTPSYQLMAVVVVAMALVTLPLVYLQRYLLRMAERYVTMGGRGSQSRPLRLGRRAFWTSFNRRPAARSRSSHCRAPMRSRVRPAPRRRDSPRTGVG